MSITNGIIAEEIPQPDVIIVGAGLSGLSSALKILEKEPSLQIKIIESANTIGGQVANTKLGEIGGKWITEDQYHIYSLLRDLGLTQRRRRISSTDLPRSWDIDRGLTALLVNHELGRYIKELDLSSQYFRPGMHNGADPADISFNDFMQICYSCGGLKMLIDLYIICPETLWEIKSADLFNVLQQKLANVEIILKRQVIEVRHYRDHVELLDSQKELHKADVTILAIPKNNIEDIKIIPTIPMELRKPPPPLDRVKYVMTSFIAQYVAGHWRSAGYNGNLFLNEPFLIIGYEYRPNIYSGIIVHEEGIEPLVRQIILSALSSEFGEEMFLPLEYFQRVFDLSPMTNMPFTSPWNRVIWSSSSSSATSYRGRLSGAVQSGYRAAMNALFILRPQTVGWQDIAEVQRTSLIMIGPQASRLSVWTSSWNIFNLSSFGLYSLGIAALIGFAYKNYF